MMIPYGLPVAAAVALYGYFIRYGRYTANFTPWEMIQSETGGVQWPPPQVIGRQRWGAVHVLQPLRDTVGALRVTSGYRTKSTNAAIPGASATSDHLTGGAADLVPLETSIDEVIAALKRSAIPYDQLIAYPGHLHVGWRTSGGRRQFIDKRL